MEKYIDSGIIEPRELKKIIDQPDVRILDSTFTLPGDALDPASAWRNSRIGDAAFFDIHQIADKVTELPHMLPPADEFEEAACGLGISSGDLVVVYGQTGMIMGPARAWWMFRAFGHKKICVLNGGLPAWLAEGLPLNEDQPSPITTRGSFRSNFQEHLVKSMEQVRKALDTGAAQLCDARPADRFQGKAAEPRPGMRPGHMPGSLNLPAGEFINPDGKIKGDSEIRHLIEEKGYSSESPTICSCGSGVTACVIALGLYKIGIKDASVYDGSWAEWGKNDSNMPVSKI